MMSQRLSTGTTVALIYAVFGCLWIAASDYLTATFVDDSSILYGIGMVKGCGFVLFTAVLIYFLLRARRWPGDGVRATAFAESFKNGQRHLLFTFLGLALGAPLLGYGIFRLHGPQIEREAYANLIAIARLKAEGIENWLAERQGDASVLLTNRGLAEQIDRFAARRQDAGLSGPILERLQHFRKAYSYDCIELFDAGGSMLMNSGGSGETAPEISKLVDRALASRELQRSELYRDASGAAHLVWVAPLAVSDPQGERVVAAIVLHANPESFLFPLIQAWPTASPTAESLVVRREGDFVLFLNRLRHREDSGPGLRLPLAAAALPAAMAVRAGIAGIAQGIDYRGREVLAAYRPIKGTDWHLLAKIDRAEVLAPVGALVVWVSLMVFFAVTLASAALLMLWRQRQSAHQWELTSRTAAAVAESEARLRTLMDNAPAMIFMKDPGGQYLLVNRRFQTFHRMTEAEVQGKTDHDLFPADLAEALAKNDAAVIRDGVPVEVEESLPQDDGVHTYLSVKFPLRRSTGEIYALCGIASDISERKRAEAKIQRLTRFYAALSRCNVAIVRSGDEQELFAEICRTAVEYGGMKMAWVGLVDFDTRMVRPAACAGAGTEYLDDLQVSIDEHSPLGQGPTGSAIRQSQPVWCQDFLGDRFTMPWHERGEDFGWRASAALPLHCHGVAVGALTLYADERNVFDETLRQLHVEMATDISFALDKFATERERRKAEKALKESEALFHTLAMSAPVGIFRTDAAGNYIFVNQRWCDFAGIGVDEALGKGWMEAIAPEDRAGVVAAWESSSREGKPFQLEYRFHRPDGSVAWGMGRAEPERDAAGSILGYIGTVTDVTTLKLSEERLRQAAVVFENSREGIMVTDADARILLVNRAFSEMTGYSAEEMLGQSPRLLKSGRHDREFYAHLWEQLECAGHWHGEIWNRRKDGEIFPELLSISAVEDDAGRVNQYVGIFTDISQIKNAAEKLDYLAHHDPLTGLPNRLLLFDRLQHSLDVALREHKILALLMLDLDRFKDVNDSFGHLAGDELLQMVADRLINRLRGIDTVTRLGGDEFTVLLEDLSHPQDAAQVAWEIISTLNEPWRLSNGAEVRLGTSVGIALFPTHGQTAETLLQHADAALYRAKAEGRGNFKFFTDELTFAARRRIKLESLLRRAIGREELRLHYQPQIEMVTGRIVGAEALVRWQDPVEGLIPPSHFIPVAEETGLIAEVGEWVLRETCRQGREWLDAGLPPLNMAVNLSPYQFRYGDIQATLAAILAETGFPAEQLELELTESALMERETEVVRTLERLRALGVRLAIDDFGTGYSSLAYLKGFPLDVLKIDKSFIEDIPHHQDDMEIAAAIIAMGHTLRLRVLAEGVETAEQLEFLKNKGCDLYQGYFNSRPMPADAFRDLWMQVNGLG